jgi:hypothetical protein
MSDSDLSTCGRMVTRYVGNPDEPERSRQPCGRPSKYRLRAAGSKVSVVVCGRHARWSPSLNGLVPVTVEPILPAVPTPAEVDDLLARISATGYASEAVEIVEAWIERRWGVVGDFTRKQRQEQPGWLP